MFTCVYNKKNKKVAYEKDQETFCIDNNNYIFIFEGFLYYDINYSILDIFKYFKLGNIAEDFKKFKGKYSGFFYNKSNNTLISFNDQLGLEDIYYYHDNELIILSNYFNLIDKIVRNHKIKLSIDEVAIAEFLLFEHPINRRTFYKEIKILDLATIKLFNSHVKEIKYWQYINNPCLEKESIDQAVDKLDQLFSKSIKRIKNYYKDKIFGLGVSGGMDSRITLHYALKEKMPLKLYTFGHKNSDIYYTTRKIENAINKKIEFLKINKKIKNDHINKSMHTFSMMNSMYLFYYSVIDKLPEFDVLLSGFLGDHLFGKHINLDEKNNFSNDYIYKQFKVLDQGDFMKFIDDNIRKEILKDLKKYRDLPWWVQTQQFDYQERQLRFIKNNPAMTYLLKYKNTSIFTDIDLIEYVLKLPAKYLLDCNLYNIFIKKKLLKKLSKIRPEGKPYSKYDFKIIKFIKKVIYFLERKSNINIFFPFKKYNGHLNWIELAKKNIKDITNFVNNDKIYYNSFLNNYKVSSVKKVQIIYLIYTINLFYDKQKKNIKKQKI